MVNSSLDSLENIVLVVVTETVSKKGTSDNYQRISSIPKRIENHNRNASKDVNNVEKCGF